MQSIKTEMKKQDSVQCLIFDHCTREKLNTDNAD